MNSVARMEIRVTRYNYSSITAVNHVNFLVKGTFSPYSTKRVALSTCSVSKALLRVTWGRSFTFVGQWNRQLWGRTCLQNCK